MDAPGRSFCGQQNVGSGLEEAVRTSPGTGKTENLLAVRQRRHKRHRVLAKAGRIDIEYVRPHDRGRR